jgi:hypothetical protein
MVVARRYNWTSATVIIPDFAEAVDDQRRLKSRSALLRGIA